ncbi:hypothetical protein [Paraburkholderia sediminicola]|uniref:hypothetical protein n=1 Tax=Paraburkholderia sediminicola TaxID=458836 RepID=UPI0038B99169
MTDEQLREASFGTHREPIVDWVKQLDAVRRVGALHSEGYPVRKPWQELLGRLANTEKALITSASRQSA